MEGLRDIVTHCLRERSHAGHPDHYDQARRHGIFRGRCRCLGSVASMTRRVNVASGARALSRTATRSRRARSESLRQMLVTKARDTLHLHRKESIGLSLNQRTRINNRAPGYQTADNVVRRLRARLIPRPPRVHVCRQNINHPLTRLRLIAQARKSLSKSGCRRHLQYFGLLPFA